MTGVSQLDIVLRKVIANMPTITAVMSLIAVVLLSDGRSLAEFDSGRELKPSPAGARFVKTLQVGKKVTIVSMGTSLTGGTWRWPDVMMSDWLNKDFPGQVKFYNEGVGASSTAVGPAGNKRLSGLGKLPSVIAHNPDVVFIEFGTNDAYLPYKTSVGQAKKNLTTIVDGILAANPNAEVILMTMNSCRDKPGNDSAAGARPELAAYFQIYRDVAKQRNLLLVDAYPAWLKIMIKEPRRFDRLVPDGIHPHAEGYREVLLPLLKETLASK
jgi:acyl-CoA thioesterase I